MRKSILSMLWTSIVITSSSMAMEASDTSEDFIPAKGVSYTIRPKNLNNYVAGYSKEASNSGNYMQVVDYVQKDAQDVLWLIEPAKTAGYFTISSKEVPGSFLTWSFKESDGGYYMQMCTYADRGEDDQWQIEAVQDTGQGPVYYKLMPKPTHDKIKVGYIATYSDINSWSGKYMHIVPKDKYDDASGRNSFALVPQGYKLKAVVSDLVFGKGVKEKLMANATPKFFGESNLIVKDPKLNPTVSITLNDSVTETFRWGLNQKLGVSASVSFEAGIPLVTQTNVTVTTSAEFGAHQEWEGTNTKSITGTVTINPSEPGVYKLGTIVYMTKDIVLPFTAKAKLKATNKDNELLSAAVVEALFKYEGLEGKIVKRGPKAITVAVKGKMTASYGFKQKTVVDKVGELKKKSKGIKE